MDRIRRNERLAAMARILVESPNKIYTLGTFCEMFGAAKSTLSEDIDILRGVFTQFKLGQVDTVTGAAGGLGFTLAIVLFASVRERLDYTADYPIDSVIVLSERIQNYSGSIETDKKKEDHPDIKHQGVLRYHSSFMRISRFHIE